jgi:predicted helicase
VSINIFVKTADGKLPTKVYQYDLFGKRDEKYTFLSEQKFLSIKWEEINPEEPYFFFVPKDFVLKTDYENGFCINELFPVNSSGIKTQRDDASISITQEECVKIRNDILILSNQELSQKYGFVDVRDWTITEAKKDLQENKIIADRIQYRPFDFRSMNYTGKTKGIMGYPRYEVMRHFIANDNVGLVVGRQGQVVGSMPWNLIFITKDITDINLYYRGGSSIFPLYLYPDKNILDKTEKRRPNLNTAIIDKIAEKINLLFTDEKTDESKTFAPIDILDYIYAVLHSPAYREKYREFLKIDFPRIPYPADAKQFRSLVGLGAKLREIHLLEGITPSEKLVSYPVEGSNTIDGLTYKDKKVWINKTQYFDKVPPEVWNFYIGGYQPAQKWLKDRKGQTLNFDDIKKKKKIVNALYLTGDIQRKIDEIIDKKDEELGKG